MGATEIGQGSDTVFAQMVSEILNIPFENVHMVSNQDTDITPFDTGLMHRGNLMYQVWQLKKLLLS